MILFVNLPISDFSTAKTKVMPLSLVALIAYLRNHSYKSDIIDLTIKNEFYLFDYLTEQEPPVIGLSIMVAGQMNYAISLSHKIKSIFPKCQIIAGGTHASQFAEDIERHCPDIDIIFRGEGEGQIIHYCQTGIIHNPGYITDIPIPAYDVLNFEDYRCDNSTWHNPYGVDLGIRVPVFTSRGCPNLCNFCSVQSTMGYKYRTMPAARVVDMFEQLNQKGIVYFAVYDANFSQSRRRVIDICNEIKQRNLKIYLDIPAGLPVNVSTSEMIDALAECGLIRTKVAIESIDDTIRNGVMHKRVTRDQIYRSTELIRKHKQIHLTADFIIGMPEETGPNLWDTMDFIKEFDIDDIGINIATPYPDTGLWDQCMKDGLFTIDPATLWNDPLYSHTYLNRFTIKPYNCSLDMLSECLSRLIDLKNEKIKKYKLSSEKN